MNASRNPRRPLLAALTIATLLAPSTGCEQPPAFDRAAESTPESLAQELAFRFNALSPSGKAARRSRRPEKKAVPSKADELSTTKSQSKAATKKELAKTVDDVLDEIAEKADRIKGMSRSAVYSGMIDSLARESTLREKDREMLAGKLREMSGG
jgi:hypothetical protein